jgi:hypothetical protein
MAGMRRLNTFLVLGLTGVVVLLAGLSWDAMLHGADPDLALHEAIFTLANPGHVTLGAGVGLVVAGVVGALDASLRVSATAGSSVRRRRATLGVVAVPLVASLAVAGWALTRPAPAADQPAAGDAHHVADDAASAAGDGHHGTDLAAGDAHHGAGDTDPAAVTARERMEADALVTATKFALASAGFEDVAVAEAAGYRPVQPPTSSLVHYVNLAHLASPEVLDPTAPESLVYRSTPHGPVLEGAMYILPSVDSPVPDVGGLAAHWHGHDDLCFSTATAMVVGTLGPDGRCPEGARNEITPPMLHVWIVDRPGGPFAGL